METNKPYRVVLMFVGFFTVIAAITFNSLSGFGTESGIFKQTTEKVTLKYTTPLTPVQWALFVWDFIYIWLFAMFIYFIVGLCRRNAYEWMYTTPAVLPYGFHISIIINVCLNITWLFLFDRELMLPMLITSALITITTYMILFFACHGMKIYGAWLHKHSKADLWIIRVLVFIQIIIFCHTCCAIIQASFTLLNQVQNGVAVYATWGFLSTLHHLTIYLQYQTETLKCDCAMVALVLLLIQLLAWFPLENFYLDEHVRYIVTIYPVAILWLTGVLSNSNAPKSQTYIFLASILALTCVLFVTRLALIRQKHQKQPFYCESGPPSSPVEIALTQRKLFL